MSSYILAALVAGCTDKTVFTQDSTDSGQPENPSHDPNNSPSFSPKVISVSSSITTPITSGSNQTLIAANNGGVFVISKNFGDATAFLQYATSSGFQGTPDALPHPETYNYGWGTQSADGDLLIPYQSFGNTDHGVLTLHEDGSLVADHQFANVFGKTGTGAVAKYGDSAVAIMNNADYSKGFPVYDDNSSLIVFDPSTAGSGEVFSLSTSVNASGLVVHGDTAYIASAGNYVNPESASFAEFDLVSDATGNTTDSFLSLGLNGNLPYKKNNILLTGYNPEIALALYDGQSVREINLPSDCVSGSVTAAQFVTVQGDDMQILASATNFETQKSSVVSIVGNMDANTWECATIDERNSVYGVGLVGSATAFASATDSEIVFLEAQ